MAIERSLLSRVRGWLGAPRFHALLPLPIVTALHAVPRLFVEERRRDITETLHLAGFFVVLAYIVASAVIRHLRYRYDDPEHLGRAQDCVVFSLLGFLAAIAFNMYVL